MAVSTKFTCPVVVILGSTGCGKSKLAIQIAKVFGGDIISADSMQVYKGLNIITNKVSSEELSQCQHHMINYLSPLKFRSTVVEFQDAALPIIQGLIGHNKPPVVVGGTNYYIEALLWNFIISKQDVLMAADVVNTLSTSSTLGEEPKTNSTKSTVSHVCGGKVEVCDVRQSISTLTVHHTGPLHDSNTNSSLDINTGISPDVYCESNIVDILEPASEFSHTSTSHEMTFDGCHDHACHGKPADALENNDVLSDCTVSVDASVNIHSSDGSHPDFKNQELEADGKNVASRAELCISNVEELYRELQTVDPETAQRLHPNDRRKILRALQVYEQHGIPMSAIHHAQKSSGGQLDISGPLRYPHTCILWIQCDMEVLGRRLDERVDKMLENGLIQELTDFHDMYNKDRLEKNEVADYTLGIFQSIGFKEFHKFLILSMDERKSEQGKQLFQEGVDDLKRMTRKYARKQIRWIQNRFLKRPGSSIPLVFGLDGADLSKWEENVENPALEILKSVIEGKTPPYQPLAYAGEREARVVRNVCDVCGGRVFVIQTDWEAHLRSRGHKKRMQKQSKKNKEAT